MGLCCPSSEDLASQGGRQQGTQQHGLCSQRLVGSVFSSAVLHELHHDSDLVGWADGCRLPFSLPLPYSVP